MCQYSSLFKKKKPNPHRLQTAGFKLRLQHLLAVTYRASVFIFLPQGFCTCCCLRQNILLQTATGLAAHLLQVFAQTPSFQRRLVKAPTGTSSPLHPSSSFFFSTALSSQSYPGSPHHQPASSRRAESFVFLPYSLS